VESSSAVILAVCAREVSGTSVAADATSEAHAK
jgi:hypothetical protein